jgi:hypothetical protein
MFGVRIRSSKIRGSKILLSPTTAGIKRYCSTLMKDLDSPFPLSYGDDKLTIIRAKQ